MYLIGFLAVIFVIATINNFLDEKNISDELNEEEGEE